MTMTDDRKLKEAIRARQARTGESYMEARRHILASSNQPRRTELPTAPPAGPSISRAERGSISLEDLNEDIIFTPEDQELLVPSTDPDHGPYTLFIRVPKADVDEHCRRGFRRITWGEEATMMGEPEDYTADWKHSD
jgi:hypothetical protein